jgi:hypothetical protein
VPHVLSLPKGTLCRVSGCVLANPGIKKPSGFALASPEITLFAKGALLFFNPSPEPSVAPNDSSSEKAADPYKAKGSATHAVYSKSIIYAWYSILPHAFDCRE